MSGTKQRPDHAAHGADPWWGGEVDADGVAFVDLDAAVAGDQVRPTRRAAPRHGAHRGALTMLLGLLAVPLVALAGVVSRSPRLRTYAVRGLIIVAILIALACSVGVILINNVVIGRTAELGRLDDERRELRRENALLGAEAAQLSAPQVIERSARLELGMVRPDKLPRFIFLDPASRTLTPAQRQLVAAKNARIRAAGEAASATTPTEKATTP